MPDRRTLLLTVLAMLAFAGNSLLCRAALKDTAIDAVSFTALRLFSGALMLAVLLHLRRRPATPARGDWRGLGLDVETLLEAERARYLHGEILTEGERLRFADDLERRTGLLVTLAFSLKESLFKALYPLVGKRFYFEHAELLEWRADGQARLRLLTDLSPEWRHGSELDAQFAVLDERLLSLVAVGA